jgi:hypothetical protein
MRSANPKFAPATQPQHWNVSGKNKEYFSLPGSE